MLARPQTPSVAETSAAARKARAAVASPVEKDALAALKAFRKQAPSLSTAEFNEAAEQQRQPFAFMEDARRLVAECVEEAQDGEATLEEAA